VAHLEWRCTIVGPVDRDPDFVDDLRASMGHGTLCERIRLTGARPPEGVRCAYRNADLLVLPSRSESYGMVVTEALAHGLPVVASAVGGVGEALGSTRHGRPGLLVAPGDVEALAEALRRWLTDPALRDRLRTAALDRRRTLPTWAAAAAAVERALEMVAA
jgi:glycosyltransferase involved in cell wall biosynthesis